ncbi:hypothetical protein ACJJTC_006987 [Scirpophaga incertulas]
MSSVKAFWGKLILLCYCTLLIHGFVLNDEAVTDDPGDNNMKMFVDHDGGADDAMGMFIVMLREECFGGFNIIGISTVNGNVNESQAFINTQRILNVADRLDIPIYRGSPSALVMGYPSDNFFGKDGLGDHVPQPYEEIQAQGLQAAQALVELSKQHEGNLIVVAIGPLTNIALAIKLDPNFIQRLQHLYVGAGNIHSDAYPNPEFNAQLDVEAYYIVAQNSDPNLVTFVPFSQIIDSMLMPQDWRTQTLGSIQTKIMEAQNSYEVVSQATIKDVWVLLDPAVMSIALNNDIIESTLPSNQSITLCGTDRGIVTNDFNSDSVNVNVINATSLPKYQQFLLDTFSCDLNQKILGFY